MKIRIPNRSLRVYFPRPGAARRVVFFPHGGGAASFYRPLARLLPDDVEGVVVQYAGREDRLDDTPHDTMASLVDELTDAVGCLFDRPVCFFGHSMGASVVHEVTRRLTRAAAGDPTAPLPGRLVLSGRAGPARQTTDDKHLDDDRLWGDVCRLGGTDARLLAMPEVRAMAMPAIRADYRLVETYRAGLDTDLSMPVSACFGGDDPEVSQTDAEAWRVVTAGEFDVRRFEGDHFYLRNGSEEALVTWLVDSLAADPTLAEAGTNERNQR